MQIDNFQNAGNWKGEILKCKKNYTDFNLYIYILIDEPTSKVHGYVYNDVFQGRIKFDNVPTYVIESTFPYADKIDTKRYHSFIYQHKDMHEPESIKFAATEAKGMSRYGLFF